MAVAGYPETSVHSVTALLAVAAIRISESTVWKGDCQMRTGSTAVVVVATDCDSSASRVALNGKTSWNWAPATVLVPRPRIRGGLPPQHARHQNSAGLLSVTCCCCMELRITWFESRSSERVAWQTYSISFQPYELVSLYCWYKWLLSYRTEFIAVFLWSC